jgi:hypothetical protein
MHLPFGSKVIGLSGVLGLAMAETKKPQNGWLMRHDDLLFTIGSIVENVLTRIYR